MFYLYHIPEPDKKLYFKTDTIDCVICTPLSFKAKKFSTRDFAILRADNLYTRFGLDFKLEEV